MDATFSLAPSPWTKSLPSRQIGQKKQPTGEQVAITGDEVPIIRLEGLRKMFGGVAAIESLNLDICAGEFFTFLGPSGSGKTTTLRMSTRSEQPEMPSPPITARGRT